MTQVEIIEMPPYLNASYEGDDLYSGNQVRELMKLVAAKATEKANARANASWTLMCKKRVAFERDKSLKLWMLLDDVDTADDIAKADDAIYRSLCRQTHKKRWDVLTGDDVDNAIRARGEQA